MEVCYILTRSEMLFLMQALNDPVPAASRLLAGSLTADSADIRRSLVWKKFIRETETGITVDRTIAALLRSISRAQTIRQGAGGTLEIYETASVVTAIRQSDHEELKIRIYPDRQTFEQTDEFRQNRLTELTASTGKEE